MDQTLSPLGWHLRADMAKALGRQPATNMHLSYQYDHAYQLTRSLKDVSLRFTHRYMLGIFRGSTTD